MANEFLTSNCSYCEYFEAYDDGDGRTDCWCENVNVTMDEYEQFLFSNACPFYIDIEFMEIWKRYEWLLKF